MKKTVLKKIYEFGGFKPFHFLNRNELLILTYHRFSENGGMLSVSRDDFAEHLAYLKKHTNVITLDDAIDALSTDNELPSNAVVITIDDGYRDAYEIAFPILQESELPATLYVITDFLNRKIWLWTDLMRYLIDLSKASEFRFEDEMISGPVDSADQRTVLAGRVNSKLKELPDDVKWQTLSGFFQTVGIEKPAIPTDAYAAISWAQAKEMDENGVKIECHTVNHPILTKVSSDSLTNELRNSRHEIETRLDKKVRHFCYPNGSFNDAVASEAEKQGFDSATTTNYGFARRDSDLFRLKRISGQPSIANFAQSVSGFEVFREKIGI